MNSGGRATRGFLVALGLVLPLPLWATPVAHSEPGTNASIAAALQTPSPPVPPPAKSPVDVFRELLAMPEAARGPALTNKPAPIREQILKKVREYEAFTPNERELRLRVTGLQWYLSPLMSVPPTNRVAELDRIPDAYRELVTERIREWDQLSPEVQKDIRENQTTMRYFTDLEGATEEQQKRMQETLTPARREQLQRGIAQWRALPEQQRQRALSSFNRIFTLDEPEKQRVLSTLSDAERRRIENTIRSYRRFTPEERARCLKALDKFTRLSLEEREKFLQNAERWKTMPPDEREAWNQLVTRLSPRPPVPVPLPPVPHSPPSRSLATNTGGG